MILVATNVSAVSRNKLLISMRRRACCWTIAIDERSHSPAVEVQLVIHNTHAAVEMRVLTRDGVEDHIPFHHYPIAHRGAHAMTRSHLYCMIQ